MVLEMNCYLIYYSQSNFPTIILILHKARNAKLIAIIGSELVPSTRKTWNLEMTMEKVDKLNWGILISNILKTILSDQNGIARIVGDFLTFSRSLRGNLD